MWRIFFVRFVSLCANGCVSRFPRLGRRTLFSYFYISFFLLLFRFLMLLHGWLGDGSGGGGGNGGVFFSLDSFLLLFPISSVDAVCLCSGSFPIGGAVSNEREKICKLMTWIFFRSVGRILFLLLLFSWIFFLCDFLLLSRRARRQRRSSTHTYKFNTFVLFAVRE